MTSLKVKETVAGLFLTSTPGSKIFSLLLPVKLGGYGLSS
jgi:hypothetical protein